MPPSIGTASFSRVDGGWGMPLFGTSSMMRLSRVDEAAETESGDQRIVAGRAGRRPGEHRNTDSSPERAERVPESQQRQADRNGGNEAERLRAEKAGPRLSGVVGEQGGRQRIQIAKHCEHDQRAEKNECFSAVEHPVVQHRRPPACHDDRSHHDSSDEDETAESGDQRACRLSLSVGAKETLRKLHAASRHERLVTGHLHPRFRRGASRKPDRCVRVGDGHILSIRTRGFLEIGFLERHGAHALA